MQVSRRMMRKPEGGAQQGGDGCLVGSRGERGALGGCNQRRGEGGPDPVRAFVLTPNLGESCNISTFVVQKHPLSIQQHGGSVYTRTACPLQVLGLTATAYPELSYHALRLTHNA